MVIIPFLCNASTWDDNELRYCLRSICEYQPDIRVLLVGNPPAWYRGEYLPYDDKKGLVFKTWNIIEKIKLAAPYEDFILTNDDIFLLAPFRENHYKGSLSDTHKGLATHYRAQVDATIDLIGDTPDFDTHGPMQMNGKKFRALPWPEYRDPYILARTFYAHYTGKAGDFYPDLKINRRYTPDQLTELLKDRLYFSISDAGINLALATWLKNKFPNKCKYEL
jgi:hypothetical protein